MMFSLGLFFQLLVLATSLENRCPTGWKFSPPSGTCLWMSGKRNTWVLADAHCGDLGASLVCIPNVAMSTFMKTNFKGYDNDRYWIGLNDQTFEGHFRWRINNTDVKFYYSDWGSGDPKNHHSYHCVAVGFHSNQQWSAVHCGNKNRYLCERASFKVAGQTCPTGWKLNPYTDTCLKMFEDRKTWARASESCLTNFGALARITDEQSSNFIKSHFMGDIPYQFWIGLNDNTYEGSYRWHTFRNGEVEWELLEWQRGQPDNNQNQDCVAVGQDDMQTWADDECWTNYRYVCEKPAK